MPIGEFTAMLFKIVFGVLLIIALIHEEKIATLEKKVFVALRRRFRKSRQAAIKRQEELTVLNAAHTTGEWAS